MEWKKKVFLAADAIAAAAELKRGINNPPVSLLKSIRASAFAGFHSMLEFLMGSANILVGDKHHKY